MAFGVIRVRYGGADNLRLVDKEEFYRAYDFPPGACVDRYIDIEEYEAMKCKCNDIIKGKEDMYVKALKERDAFIESERRSPQRTQNMQVENDKLRLMINDLRDQLDRANHVIDYMLEKAD